MTENIQQKIGQILEKVNSFHHRLTEQVERNQALISQIDTLNEEINSLKGQLDDKTKQVAELAEKSVSTIEQNAPSSVRVSGFEKHEIDELVKEIEYCISQLKK